MLKVVIAGSGAVGQVVGGMLALDGHQVTFLAREGSQRLDDINRRGVSVNNLRDSSQSFNAQARAVSTLDGAQPADLVLLTTKTYSTDAVLNSLGPVVGQDTLLISLQNGVESADKMRAFFQRGIVLGAFCFMGGAVLPSGVVSLNSPPKVIVGDLDGTASEHVQSVVEAFSAAKILTERSPDIQRDLWIKLMWNVGIFQWCAIKDCTVGDLLSSPTKSHFVRDTMLEVVQVAQAMGVHISETDIDQQIATALTHYAPVTPSLLQDLRAGRPLEHDSFSGFISRQGAILRIPTPRNDWLFGELNRLIGNRQLQVLGLAEPRSMTYEDVQRAALDLHQSFRSLSSIVLDDALNTLADNFAAYARKKHPGNDTMQAEEVSYFAIQTTQENRNLAFDLDWLTVAFSLTARTVSKLLAPSFENGGFLHPMLNSLLMENRDQEGAIDQWWFWKIHLETTMFSFLRSSDVRMRQRAIELCRNYDVFGEYRDLVTEFTAPDRTDLVRTIVSYGGKVPEALRSLMGVARASFDPETAQYYILLRHLDMHLLTNAGFEVLNFHRSLKGQA